VLKDRRAQKRKSEASQKVLQIAISKSPNYTTIKMKFIRGRIENIPSVEQRITVDTEDASIVID